jgi:hypothetical protein
VFACSGCDLVKYFYFNNENKPADSTFNDVNFSDETCFDDALNEFIETQNNDLLKVVNEETEKIDNRTLSIKNEEFILNYESLYFKIIFS